MKNYFKHIGFSVGCRDLTPLIRKSENWRRGGYYLMMIIIAFLTIAVFWDTAYVVINNGYPPLGYPIGSECCGWAYKTVKNHTIYGITSFFVYLGFLIFIGKSPMRYDRKLILTLIFVSLFFLVQNFINPLP